MAKKSLRRVPLWLASLAGALVIASLSPAVVAGQAKKAGPIKTPRTSWGDPDFQGNYTNLYEAGTPLERPDQFSGRKLNEITIDELKAFKHSIQENTIQRFETPFDAPSNWWQVAFRLDDSAQAWLITDPEDGRIPPLTPDAQQRDAARVRARQTSGRGAADSYEERSLYDRCITRGFPTSGMPTIYGNSSRIVQGPGYIAIQYEMIHETRIIPIDREPRPHVGQAIRLDMGDSRGHWEGDTLVVHTTNVRDRSAFRNANADTLSFTERFTRTAPDKLRWSVTVDDPKTWTRPWTFSMPLTMTDSEPIMQYECHEGNYGLRNILSAARAEENAEKAADKRPPAGVQ
jgi:hypothetical protein